MKIAVINGPNLNLIGLRDVSIYGSKSFDQMNSEWERFCEDRRINLTKYQSNSEGDIIAFIHSLIGKVDGVVINAGAFSHTSLAIADAVRCLKTIKIEVHISNIFKREEYRQKSYLSSVCDATISGMGSDGYLMALAYLYKKLNANYE